MLKISRPEQYSCISNIGEVAIRRSVSKPNRWDFLIGGRPILLAFFTSAEQAAEMAHARDFGDETLNAKFASLRVSADLEGCWKYDTGSKFSAVNASSN